jgi:large subunit ribosomal protein L4
MPTTVTKRSSSGADSGTVELDGAVFGIEPNLAVMHQVVTAQLAHRRAGTQSTKTRAEVRGGGHKPFKQKGTGNARQGSTRAPHWSGGGVALGPKPRSYAQRTPKKMIKLALRSALSDRAAEGRVVVVDRWAFDGPKTKDAVKALESLGIGGSVLIVVDREDESAIKSFRNLPGVQIIATGELNAYDVLCNTWIVFTEATLPGETVVVEGTVVTEETTVEEPAVDESVEETPATPESTDELGETTDVPEGGDDEDDVQDAVVEDGGLDDDGEEEPA